MNRPLADTERATLALQAAFSLSFGSYLAPSLGRALLTLLAGFLLLGVPLAIGKVDFAAWPAKDLLVLGVAGVFAFWTGIAARDYRRRLRELAPRRAALHADLEGGVASVERYRATNAIRAIGPENRERCYFMRLDDGRVMFVGFWNPTDGDASADAPEIGDFPAAEFEVALGPCSRIVLGVTGLGGILSPSETFTLGHHVLEQGRLPENGSVIASSWGAIVKTFGAES